MRRSLGAAKSPDVPADFIRQINVSAVNAFKRNAADIAFILQFQKIMFIHSVFIIPKKTVRGKESNRLKYF